jgi:hypothetical protein
MNSNEDLVAIQKETVEELLHTLWGSDVSPDVFQRWNQGVCLIFCYRVFVFTGCSGSVYFLWQLMDAEWNGSVYIDNTYLRKKFCYS